MSGSVPSGGSPAEDMIAEDDAERPARALSGARRATRRGTVDIRSLPGVPADARSAVRDELYVAAAAVAFGVAASCRLSAFTSSGSACAPQAPDGGVTMNPVPISRGRLFGSAGS